MLLRKSMLQMHPSGGLRPSRRARHQEQAMHGNPTQPLAAHACAAAPFALPAAEPILATTKQGRAVAGTTGSGTLTDLKIDPWVYGIGVGYGF
jgi:hypothetical protein